MQPNIQELAVRLTKHLPLKKAICFFDIESTGTDVATDKIVQLTMIKVFPTGEISQFDYLVNPGRPIPAEATAVHGISDEMVANKPKIDYYQPHINSMVLDADVCGYNIDRFDVPLLVQELNGNIDLSKSAIIDLFIAYKKLYPQTLSAVYKRYTGKDIEGAHNALYDTAACIEILCEMLLCEEHMADKSYDEVVTFTQYEKSNRVDFAKKFIYNEQGEIVINFGVNKGKLAKNEIGLMYWMLDRDFTTDTKNWCRKIVNNEI